MTVQILTYHKLSNGEAKNKYVIQKGEFEDHLKYLQADNYHGIIVDDLYRALINTEHKLPEKYVLITFDDGWESDFSIALPLLKKFNFKATFFVTVDFIGSNGYVTEEQLKTLSKEGMSVQSHAKTHSFLDGITEENMRFELIYSKNRLQDIIKKKVSFISFPGGRYNEQVLKSVEKEGYLAAFSSVPYYSKKCGNIYLIGRSMVRYSEKEHYFNGLFQVSYIGRLKIKVVHMGKLFLQKILGDKMYYNLWKKWANLSK